MSAPKNQFHLSDTAEKEFQHIIHMTYSGWGVQTARRYHVLIRQAIRDLAKNPERNFVKQFDDGNNHWNLYHIRHSKKRSVLNDKIITRPRHIIVFRRTRENIYEIARILYDAMDIEHHLTHAQTEK